MAECDYYFRLNSLMMRFVCNENSTLKNTACIQTTYKKIIDILESYLRYRLSCNQLQVILVFVEYVMMIKADMYSKRVLVMFYIIPGMLQKHNPEMTVNTALTRAATRQFEHRMATTTPYSFVRWFISRPVC